MGQLCTKGVVRRKTEEAGEGHRKTTLRKMWEAREGRYKTMLRKMEVVEGRHKIQEAEEERRKPEVEAVEEQESPEWEPVARRCLCICERATVGRSPMEIS